MLRALGAVIEDQLGSQADLDSEVEARLPETVTQVEVLVKVRSLRMALFLLSGALRETEIGLHSTNLARMAKARMCWTALAPSQELSR